MNLLEQAYLSPPLICFPFLLPSPSSLPNLYRPTIIINITTPFSSSPWCFADKVPLCAPGLAQSPYAAKAVLKLSILPPLPP